MDNFEEYVIKWIAKADARLDILPQIMNEVRELRTWQNKVRGICKGAGLIAGGIVALSSIALSAWAVI